MERMTRDEYRAFLMSEPPHTGKLATTDSRGNPHVVPIWFVVDGDSIVFMTGESAVKAGHMQRNPHVALCVDDEKPPFSFVIVKGQVEFLDISQEERLKWATVIGGRYMGADKAEAFGRRNAVPGELFVRLSMDKVIAQKNLSD